MPIGIGRASLVVGHRAHARRMVWLVWWRIRRPVAEWRLRATIVMRRLRALRGVSGRRGIGITRQLPEPLEVIAVETVAFSWRPTLGHSGSPTVPMRIPRYGRLMMPDVPAVQTLMLAPFN